MDEDEERIAKLLSDYGLAAEQFQKTEVGATKTPDFRVRAAEAGDHLFYCEVKLSRGTAG